VFSRAVLRIAQTADDFQPRQGLSVWAELRAYPALMLLYAGGVGAVAAGNYCNLAALLTQSGYKPFMEHNRYPLVHLIAGGPMGFNSYPGLSGRPTARSDHLHDALRAPLRDWAYLADDIEFGGHFDELPSMSV
jgi:hypothetical protein